MSDDTFAFANKLRRPTQISEQLSLFPRDRDETLVKARVSLDDLARWRQLGWISFDAALADTLEDNQLTELVFIRNIARSGLLDPLVTELLGELTKPYAYPPDTTAYNFAYGWVEVAFPDMDEMMDEHLEHWAQEKSLLGDEDRLADTAAHLMLALAQLRARKKSKD